MRLLAVDFGTSNTVAGLAGDAGAPRLVTIDGSPLMPSSVYLTDDGTLAVGRDADRQARIDPSRYEPNPKRRIDDGDLLLGSTALPVATVIAEVLRRVAGEVRRQLGGQPDQVRMTHPARWGQRRRETLVAAARQAGLCHDPVLVPEPVAAATHFATLSGSGLGEGQALAVYDLGGGTFDIAVVRRRGPSYEVLAEAGLPDLGGLDFDHAVREHIGRTHAIPADAEAWQALLQPVDAASRRMARALATDVRDGKEALSRYPHTDIALPPPFVDVHLTRAEFEDLIRPHLSRSIDLMRRTIAQAGLEPAQLAGVYLVGGSSRIPLVARLIQEGLGVTPTTLDQPETSVVTGALYLGANSVPLPAPGLPPAGPPVPGTFGGGPGQPGPSYATRPGLPAVQGAVPVRPGAVPGPVSGAQPAVSGAPAPMRPVAPFPDTPRRRPHSRRRAALLAGSGTVALALVAVLVVVLTTRGPGGGGGGGRGLASSQGPSTSHPPPAGDGNFDRYFTDSQVRDYVRPLYPDISSCSNGLLAQAVPGAATCTFDNGVQITLGHADGTLLSLNQLRELVSSTMEASEGFTRTQGTWSGGSLDTFTSTDSSAGAALYWDRRQGGIWGLAASDSLTSGELTSWWHDHFDT